MVHKVNSQDDLTLPASNVQNVIPVCISDRIDERKHFNCTRLRCLSHIETFSNMDREDKDTENALKIALPRLVRNKATYIQDFIVDNRLDILAITKSWLKEENIDQVVMGELLPDGYSLKHISRGRPGGGVAVAYKSHLCLVQNASGSFSSFEHISCSLYLGSAEIQIVVLYSPEPKSHNSVSDIFLEEFSNFLDEVLALTKEKLLLLGDFNYQVDDKKCHNINKFMGTSKFNELGSTC